MAKVLSVQLWLNAFIEESFASAGIFLPVPRFFVFCTHAALAVRHGAAMPHGNDVHVFSIYHKHYSVAGNVNNSNKYIHRYISPCNTHQGHQASPCSLPQRASPTPRHRGVVATVHLDRGPSTTSRFTQRCVSHTHRCAHHLQPCPAGCMYGCNRRLHGL